MNALVLLCLPILVLWSLPCIVTAFRSNFQLSSSLTDRFCGFVVGLLAVWFASSIGMMAVFGVSEQTTFFINAGHWFPSVRWDGVSAVATLLVTFVGWMVAKFSVRYLDGEATKARYFAWIGFTIGSVVTMVVSGNLLWTLAGWMTTSYGLHHLLLHYGDRSAAKHAAWTKFFISRLGDVAFVAAIVFIAMSFGSLQLNVLFERVAGDDLPASLNWIGALLVIAAMTKSAQFPLHGWLPETLETPTPVSALMHAGIINAGGYLIIRMSPLMVHAPGAMTMLTIVGGFTACFAAVVMLTQPSVKKQLAYSTIAQMGLMMLQCGLGAFSAAMLHLVAHSLYKAHAFLSSGNVIAERAMLQNVSTSGAAVVPPTVIQTFAAAAISLAFLTIANQSASVVLGSNSSNLGSWLLGGLLTLAISRWLSNLFATASREPAARVRLVSMGLLGTAWMVASYVAAFQTIRYVTASSLPPIGDDFGTSRWVAAGMIGLGLLSLFVLENRVMRSVLSEWTSRIHVHASNGFYFSALTRAIART